MRFGTKFWLRRGSISRQDGMGRARFVAARLLFRRGHQIYAELLEDDHGTDIPGTCWSGQRGWWSQSSVSEWVSERPNAHAGNYINDANKKD
jgi:hypothetical protein